MTAATEADMAVVVGSVVFLILSWWWVCHYIARRVDERFLIRGT